MDKIKIRNGAFSVTELTETGAAGRVGFRTLSLPVSDIWNVCLIRGEDAKAAFFLFLSKEPLAGLSGLPGSYDPKTVIGARVTAENFPAVFAWLCDPIGLFHAEVPTTFDALCQAITGKPHGFLCRINRNAQWEEIL